MTKERAPHASLYARLGALCYIAWGVFHVKVAWDIAKLGLAQSGITQGRLYQLAAYMLTISLFVIVVALWRNWKNDKMGFWLNMCVAGWADAIWVCVVVIPGYVDAVRGLVPPAVFVLGLIFTTCAIRRKTRMERQHQLPPPKEN